MVNLAVSYPMFQFRKEEKGITRHAPVVTLRTLAAITVIKGSRG